MTWVAMWGFAVGVLKAIITKIRQRINARRGDAVDPSMYSKPVKVMEYIEADSVERKAIDRQTSTRLSVPKKTGWWQRDLEGFKLKLLMDPKKPDDILKSRILIEPKWKDEDESA